MKEIMCKACGAEIDTSIEAIFPPNYTRLNNDGPYCIACFDDEQDAEDRDNSQFGVWS